MPMPSSEERVLNEQCSRSTLSSTLQICKRINSNMSHCNDQISLPTIQAAQFASLSSRYTMMQPTDGDHEAFSEPLETPKGDREEEDGFMTEETTNDDGIADLDLSPIHPAGRARLSPTHSLNDSIASTGSREEEILRTTQQLGATSLAFIHHLRGAAFRRKLKLTQSRDSLVAKEQERDRARAARLLEEESPKVFQARPVPEAVGVKGKGGISGVPKVPKRPLTTPKSPMLGFRFRKVDDPEEEALPEAHFRARPLPKTTGAAGRAGQAGVPRVPKRATTVPFSPLLGMRRPRPEPQVNHRDRNASSEPIGIELVQNVSEQENRPPRVPSPVKLHSTVRAARRAIFDRLTILNQGEKRQARRKEREQQVKVLQSEMNRMRLSL